MRVPSTVFAGLMVGIGFSGLIAATEGLAQTQTIPDSLCNAYRVRLTGHAQVSEGVRRDLASRVRALPAGQAPAVAPPASLAGRADVIRDRLQKIPGERQQAEDSRLAAYLHFEFGRAAELEQQVQALDAEKAALEREQAGLQAAGSRPPSAPAAPAAVTDANRIPCQDIAAAHSAAIKIRRRELGAREDQPGVIPLFSVKGQKPEQVARELAGAFSNWPLAASQLGLLDQDGNRHVDALVDVPVAKMLRLYWQRPDGTLSIEVLPFPDRPADLGYGELTRRVEEKTIHQTGLKMADLLAVHPASPIRNLGEIGDFARAQAFVLNGNYGDASHVEGGGARTTEFQNWLGESLRVTEVITPTANGLLLRRLVVTSRPQGEELWAETTTLIRGSQSRVDVEIRRTTERRNAAGPLAPKAVSPPVAFSVDR